MSQLQLEFEDMVLLLGLGDVEAGPPAPDPYKAERHADALNCVRRAVYDTDVSKRVRPRVRKGRCHRCQVELLKGKPYVFIVSPPAGKPDWMCSLCTSCWDACFLKVTKRKLPPCTPEETVAFASHLLAKLEEIK